MEEKSDNFLLDSYDNIRSITSALTIKLGYQFIFDVSEIRIQVSYLTKINFTN